MAGIRRKSHRALTLATHPLFIVYPFIALYCNKHTSIMMFIRCRSISPTTAGRFRLGNPNVHNGCNDGHPEGEPEQNHLTGIQFSFASYLPSPPPRAVLVLQLFIYNNTPSSSNDRSAHRTRTGWREAQQDLFPFYIHIFSSQPTTPCRAGTKRHSVAPPRLLLNR